MSKKAKPTGQEASQALGDLSALPKLEFKPTAYGREEGQGVIVGIRQQPGFPGAIGLHATALSAHTDRILLDYTSQGVAVRFRVNGLWENMPPMDRVTGDGILLVLKRLWGMNPADRRSRQDGKCALHFQGLDWIVTATSQGVPSGERVLIYFQPKKPHLKTLGDLGMREKMQESLKGHLNGHGGMVVISGPAGAGLPTSWNVAIEATDKFVRDFISIEDKHEQEPEIINVSKVLFDSTVGETPEGVLEKRLLRQPDAFVMHTLYNEKVVELLIKEMVKENRHVITRIVANDAVDAVVSLLKSFPKQAKDLIPLVRAVLNQRLVRRLCDKCKQPFQPQPQLLQKLGIPPGRVQKLYQPFVPPPPEQRVDAKGNPIEIEICKQCQGRGYFGRMAIFELLELSDEFRAALLKNPDPEFLRQIATRLGHRSFQEEGILAIALGLTSIQEMQRLMQTKATPQ